MNNLRRIKEIIKEAVSVIRNDKSMDKIEAFKSALIKINKEKVSKYLSNGPKVKGLSNSGNDWTY